MYRIGPIYNSRSKKDNHIESSSFDDIKKAKAFIVLTVILIITGTVLSILLNLSVENKLIFQTATSATTNS